MRKLIKQTGVVVLAVILLVVGLVWFWSSRTTATTPASATTPTATPAPQATPTTAIAGGLAKLGNCPTDEEMQRLFGFDKKGIKPVFTGESVPWEGCKWNVQAVGVGVYDQPLLRGWQFTVTREDNVVAVYYGDGSTLRVKGATIRHLASYNTPATQWVNDPCELLKRENDFGMRRTPSYETVSGNTQCTAQTTSAVSPVVAAPAPTATPTPKPAVSCIASPQDAETKIGGKAQYWTAPDWEGGAWVYNSKGAVVQTDLGYPGFGRLIVWIGNGPIEITTANATLLQGKTFDEASFHCR